MKMNKMSLVCAGIGTMFAFALAAPARADVKTLSDKEMQEMSLVKGQAYYGWICRGTDDGVECARV